MIYVDVTPKGCAAVCTAHKLPDVGYPTVPDNMESLKTAYRSAFADVESHMAESHKKETADGGQG